jgi:hypothetical protein
MTALSSSKEFSADASDGFKRRGESVIISIGDLDKEGLWRPIESIKSST